MMIGLYTGIAEFIGSFMNVNYLLAGTMSNNSIWLGMAMWVELAWKTAGCLELDRWGQPPRSRSTGAHRR